MDGGRIHRDRGAEPIAIPRIMVCRLAIVRGDRGCLPTSTGLYSDSILSRVSGSLLRSCQWQRAASGPTLAPCRLCWKLDRELALPDCLLLEAISLTSQAANDLLQVWRVSSRRIGPRTPLAVWSGVAHVSVYLRAFSRSPRRSARTRLLRWKAIERRSLVDGSMTPRECWQSQSGNGLPYSREIPPRNASSDHGIDHPKSGRGKNRDVFSPHCKCMGRRQQGIRRWHSGHPRNERAESKN